MYCLSDNIVFLRFRFKISHFYSSNSLIVMYLSGEVRYCKFQFASMFVWLADSLSFWLDI